MGRFTRPRPLTRRAFTEEVTRNDMLWEFNPEYDHYKQLSLMLLPAEETLHIAMSRFPLPTSVVGEEDRRHNLWPANLCTSQKKSQVHLSQKLTETIFDRSHSAGSYTERDSEAQVHQTAELSPRSVQNFVAESCRKE